VEYVNPIMQGSTQSLKTNKLLPQVDPQLVKVCKARNPSSGSWKRRHGKLAINHRDKIAVRRGWAGHSVESAPEPGRQAFEHCFHSCRRSFPEQGDEIQLKRFAIVILVFVAPMSRNWFLGRSPQDPLCPTPAR
jgi:hypothetical protein